MANGRAPRECPVCGRQIAQRNKYSVDGGLYPHKCAPVQGTKE